MENKTYAAVVWTYVLKSKTLTSIVLTRQQRVTNRSFFGGPYLYIPEQNVKIESLGYRILGRKGSSATIHERSF
jgi:hypothetical protein